MSKLHVTQIGGYLNKQLDGVLDINDYAKHPPDQRQKAFLTRAVTALAISAMTEVPLTKLADNVTDGPDDGGIDGIYFDSNEQTLYLVQSKWHEDGNGSIELGDALKFVDGVRKLLDNKLDGLNGRIKARQSDIQRALYDANARFVLVVAHTGQQGLAQQVSEALMRFVDDQNDTSELIKLRVLAQAELHKAVSKGMSGAPIALEVQLTGWGQVREPHAAFYGQVCARDVANWMTTYGSSLFSSNLRQFLGGGTVNDDIVNTLQKRPEEFWYLNNGITAVASHVAKKPIGGNSTDSGIFECFGFSVVNGAQTVGSIHAASLTSAEQVAKAMVSLRIISIERSVETFGTDVTRCTNTQNAIAKRDFVALDPEQERLRQELHFSGIEYAYKAGVASGPGTARFDLTEATVAQACASPQVDMAVQAKREISKLWDDIAKSPYKALFNTAVSGPDLWERVQTLRAIEGALQNLGSKQTGRAALVCIHGNRFIEWAAMQALIPKAGEKFAAQNGEVEQAVGEIILKTIAAVDVEYPSSYPASLFKNLTKCRTLAATIT